MRSWALSIQSNRGRGVFSSRQWLVATGLVLVAHFLLLVSPVLRWQTAQETTLLPIVTRMIEVVPALPDPQPTSVPNTAKRPPKGQTEQQPKSGGNPPPLASEKVASPPPVVVAEPIPGTIASTAPVLSSATTSPAPQGSGSGSGNGMGQGTQTNARLGRPDGQGQDTEKVVLTVPNQVKVPANREWSFATTHRSGAFYAPNLPTVFKWKVQNGQYEVYLGAGTLYSAFTKLARQSTGLVGDKGLLPSTFTAVARDGSTTNTYFERDGKDRISFGKSKAEAKPLMPGAQDEISTAIQLATMFAGEPQRYKVGDQVAVYVANRSDTQVWIFKIEADDTVDLPAGPMKAIKLTRAPRSEHDTGVTVWLAPEQQYMPVRLKLDYSSDRYDDMRWMGF